MQPLKQIDGFERLTTYLDPIKNTRTDLCHKNKLNVVKDQKEI